MGENVAFGALGGPLRAACKEGQISRKLLPSELWPGSQGWTSLAQGLRPALPSRDQKTRPCKGVSTLGKTLPLTSPPWSIWVPRAGFTLCWPETKPCFF